MKPHETFVMFYLSIVNEQSALTNQSFPAWAICDLHAQLLDQIAV